MGKSFAVYTDASYKDKLLGYSFLYYEIYGENPKDVYYGKGYALSSIEAELIAICKAVKYVSLKHEDITCINVRCDCTSIINSFNESKFLKWKWTYVKKVKNELQSSYYQQWLYLINLLQENPQIKITFNKTQKVGSKYHRVVDKVSKIARSCTVIKTEEIYCQNIDNVKRLNQI